MHWTIFCIGKPKLAYTQHIVDEYLKRIQVSVKVKCSYVKDRRMLLEKSKGQLRVALDEQGRQWSSTELAQQVTRWELNNVKEVALLIGGAEGHDEALRREADLLWSLSRLTLPHEMALVVVIEQIYRAYTIKAGSPYHRG